MIDSPVLPEELDALPRRARAGRVPGLGPAGHPRRLGPPARPPGVPRRCARRAGRAPPSGWRPSRARPSASLRDFDDEHYVVRDAAAVAGSGAVAARCRAGSSSAPTASSSSCPPAATPPTASRSGAPWLGVLVCGDYLSPVEIPMLSTGGGIDAYLETLERLRSWRAVPRRSCPATAQRSSRRTHSGSSRRICATCRVSPPVKTRGCPRAATARGSSRSMPRTGARSPDTRGTLVTYRGRRHHRHHHRARDLLRLSALRPDRLRRRAVEFAAAAPGSSRSRSGCAGRTGRPA